MSTVLIDPFLKIRYFDTSFCTHPYFAGICDSNKASTTRRSIFVVLHLFPTGPVEKGRISNKRHVVTRKWKGNIFHG